MARTATARAGNAKGTGKAKKTPKPPPKKKAKRAPNGQGKNPKTQTTFLALVRAENPGITSAEFADKFKVPFEDVANMRHFVHEYIKDFNPTNAALRMGYPEEAAASNARLFLYHSFTQLRLSEIFAEMDADAMVSGGQIVAGLLREAHAPDSLCANSSTRISAWKELARIKGLTNPKPPPPPGGFAPASGVMFVPVASHPDEWETHARETQRALKEAVTIEAEIVPS